jgi:hypothetical protein
MAYVVGMEPGTEQYGSRPDRPRDREFRGFDDRDDDRNGEYDENGNGAAVAATPRARLGLLLLIAFVIEFVVIVGLGNQWVSDKIAKLDPSTFMGAGLRNVALVFAWRFTPRPSDHDHLWLAGLLLIVTTIVVSLLLITALCRGPVTWGRAFFGSWMAVAVATMLGGYVRSAVVDTHAQGQGGRYEQALFGAVSPGSIVFLAGVLLGLVVAIVLGFVGPLTRRVPEGAVAAGYAATPTAPPPADPRPDREPAGAPGGAPWQDQHYGPPAPRSSFDPPPPYRGEDPASQRTTQLPVMDADRPGGATALGQQRDDQPVQQRAAVTEPVQQPTEQPTEALPVQRAEQPAQQEQPVQQEPVQQEQQPAQQQPPVQQEHQPAQQQPPVQQEHQPAQQQPAQQTAQFPRPPDDEDLDPEH